MFRISVFMLLLSGCGFHVRDVSKQPLPMIYQQLELELVPSAEALRLPLTRYLNYSGVAPDIPRQASRTLSADDTVLRIEGFNLYRQPFAGRLTEVQLRLVATFSLYRNQKPITASRTVVAQRSYQYDRATLNTDNQEEQYLVQVMQDDIAQQIVCTLRSNRLPAVNSREVDQAP